jgi:hypothetical protein
MGGPEADEAMASRSKGHFVVLENSRLNSFGDYFACLLEQKQRVSSKTRFLVRTERMESDRDLYRHSVLLVFPYNPRIENFGTLLKIKGDELAEVVKWESSSVSRRLEKLVDERSRYLIDEYPNKEGTEVYCDPRSERYFFGVNHRRRAVHRCIRRNPRLMDAVVECYEAEARVKELRAMREVLESCDGEFTETTDDEGSDEDGVGDEGPCVNLDDSSMLSNEEDGPLDADYYAQFLAETGFNEEVENSGGFFDRWI